MKSKALFGQGHDVSNAFIIICLATWIAAAGEADAPKGITEGFYYNFPGAIVLNCDEAEVEALVHPKFGGRILRYELMGENILWESGQIPLNPSAVFLPDFQPGGWQMELGNKQGPLSQTGVWNSFWQVTKKRDYSITLINDPETAPGVSVEKEIILAPDTGDLGLTVRIKNTADRETTFYAASRVWCKGDGFLLVPLSKYSRYNSRWAVRHQIDGQTLYDGLSPKLPNAKVLGDVLVVEAKGDEARIGVDAHAGWVAYVLNNTMFVIYYPVELNATYPNGGHTVEAFWDAQTNRRLEHRIGIEIFTPLKDLPPGGVVTNFAQWSLVSLKKKVSTHKQAKAALDKLPPNPFTISSK